jgi:hypothetical protein
LAHEILENVRQRLAALDPKSTRCEVRQEAERFQVTLTLPATFEAEAERPAGAPLPQRPAPLPARAPGEAHA